MNLAWNVIGDGDQMHNRQEKTDMLTDRKGEGEGGGTPEPISN